MPLGRISFSCVCGQRLHAPESARGKKARCPKCQRVCAVPHETKDLVDLDHVMNMSDAIRVSKRIAPTATDSTPQKRCRHCQAYMANDNEHCHQCGQPSRPIAQPPQIADAANIEQASDSTTSQPSQQSSIIKAIKSVFGA